jgi:predicted RNase H-like HicB family nuclease
MAVAMNVRARPRLAKPSSDVEAKARASRVNVPARLPGVTYERSGEWWVAEFAAFPGAYSQGRTRDEAYRNLLSAMRDLLDVYAEDARRGTTALGTR